MNIIEVRGLSKTYSGQKHAAVDGLSLDIAKGDFFGLLGGNGAGKTTTLSIICGLLSYDHGQVMVDGKAVSPTSSLARRAIGLVPQEYALYPELTARENLMFIAGLYNVGKAQAREHIAHMAQELEVADLLDQKTANMSGGEKRRFNLMAGTMHSPQVLVLDEPTVGIDVHSRQKVVQLLHNLNTGGTTIVYTSHHIDEAQSLCSNIAIMSHGRLKAFGPPTQLAKAEGCASLYDVCLKYLADAEDVYNGSGRGKADHN